MPGPRYFMLAVRLGAYMGVIQARAAEEKRREDEGLDRAPIGARGERPVEVSDTVMLNKLANEGWAEHKKEEGAP